MFLIKKYIGRETVRFAFFYLLAHTHFGEYPSLRGLLRNAHSHAIKNNMQFYYWLNNLQKRAFLLHLNHILRKKLAAREAPESCIYFAPREDIKRCNNSFLHFWFGHRAQLILTVLLVRITIYKRSYRLYGTELHLISSPKDGPILQIAFQLREIIAKIILSQS